MHQTLFADILATQSVSAVFQPIVQLQSREILGYEGLVRGPEGSPLASPVDLFAASRACGATAVLEDLCRQTVIEAFVGLGLDGKLFLNTSPAWLLGAGRAPEPLLAALAAAGLEPERVVVELTEGDATVDYAALHATAARYAARGIQLAIDDLGEGYSSLRMWSTLRPAFVKVDMYFVRDIDRDKVKLQFMRSIQDIARLLGTAVIVEGIETEAELLLIRDLGIACGQGYRIGRPEAEPSGRVPKGVMSSLVQREEPAAGEGRAGHPASATARRLLRSRAPVSPRMTNSQLFEIFAAAPELEVVPVVDNDVPIGLITRRALLDKFAIQFIRELHGRKSCAMFMDPKPLMVDQHTALQDISKLVATAERHHLFNGFIITAEGKYLGMGTGHDLVREITSMQISAARYANPLTGLPGNVPINDQIDALLGSGARFAACYFDLDHFKPFNDCYGYRAGDDVIQLTGRVLEAHANPSHDFVGHIGGDDFLILFESEDWEARCRLILDAFATAIVGHFKEEDVRRGGYVSEDRRGTQVLHPLVSLSVGIVQVEPGAFSSHLQISAVASDAKKQAKRIPGNSMFVERRQGASMQAAHAG